MNSVKESSMTGSFSGSLLAFFCIGASGLSFTKWKSIKAATIQSIWGTKWHLSQMSFGWVKPWINQSRASLWTVGKTTGTELLTILRRMPKRKWMLIFATVLRTDRNLGVFHYLGLLIKNVSFSVSLYSHPSNKTSSSSGTDFISYDLTL